MCRVVFVFATKYQKSHKIAILLGCVLSPEDSQASEPRPVLGTSVPSILDLCPLLAGPATGSLIIRGFFQSGGYCRPNTLEGH